MLENGFRLGKTNSTSWDNFILWNSLAAVEDAGGNSDDSSAAKMKAVQAYQSFRQAGGQPQRPSTKAIFEFTILLVNLSNEKGEFSRDAFDHARSKLWAEAGPEVASAIADWLSGKICDDTLLTTANGLDMYFELGCLVTAVRSGASDAGPKPCI
jgi:hypothetical protein